MQQIIRLQLFFCYFSSWLRGRQGVKLINLWFVSIVFVRAYVVVEWQRLFVSTFKLWHLLTILVHTWLWRYLICMGRCQSWFDVVCHSNHFRLGDRPDQKFQQVDSTWRREHLIGSGDTSTNLKWTKLSQSIN